MHAAAKLCATLLASLLLASCAGVPTTTSASPGAQADGATSLKVTAGADANSLPPTLDAVEAPRPVPLTPPVGVHVGHTPNGANAGIYIALARGYFEEEGLDLSLEPFDTGERIVPALSTGQVDVSAGTIGAGLFNALARGVGLKMVAGQVLDVPGPPNGAALVIRKDIFDTGRVRDYADLRGLRIGHSGASTGQGPIFARLLALGGLEEGDVEATELASVPDLATALSNGRLDAALITEPFVTRVVQAGAGVRWKNLGDIYPYRQATVLLYSPQFPQQHAEAAERFLVAYLRGVRDYVATMQGGADRTPIYRILAEYTPLKDLDLYAALAPANLSPDGALSIDSLRADQEFWVQRGLVPQPVDLTSAIDLHYLEAARRHLVRNR
jgi:NitT/TauT family transport system substrate-binding protein